MKKFLITLLAMYGLSAAAQVKIGDNLTTIGTSSLLELESTNKGLVVTRVANTAAITAPVNGMIVYDISSSCIKAYENNAWSNCIRVPESQKAVTVGYAYLNGDFIGGMAGTDNSFQVLIRNNSSSPITMNLNAADVVLSGISGLTVSRPIDNARIVNGVLTVPPNTGVDVYYPISGTLPFTGTLTATWSKLSLSGTATRTISSMSSMVATNYCTGAALNGSYTRSTAFTSGNTFTVTITRNAGGVALSGLVPPAVGNVVLSGPGAAGITVTSATQNTSGSLNAGASRTFTYRLAGTPAAISNLTATWNYADLTCAKTVSITNSPPVANAGSAQNLSYGIRSTTLSGSGSDVDGSIIAYRWRYIGGSGSSVPSIGNVYLSSTSLTGLITPGTYNFTFTVTDNEGATNEKTVTITVPPVPITIINGNNGTKLIFMAHNLGVSYSQDPNSVVKAIHGDYYQWGRVSKSADADTGSGSIAGWSTINYLPESWGATKTAYDPCPSGFRVPTRAEWETVASANTLSRVGTFTNGNANFGSAAVYTGNAERLTLPAAGHRYHVNGELFARGANAVYWSSTSTGGTQTESAIFNVHSVSWSILMYNRATAAALRCIKE